MKKFYLKISILMFITALTAIPAAAQSSLTCLIKLEDLRSEEQRALLKFYLKSAMAVICAHVLYRVIFCDHYAE